MPHPPLLSADLHQPLLSLCSELAALTTNFNKTLESLAVLFAPPEAGQEAPCHAQGAQIRRYSISAPALEDEQNYLRQYEEENSLALMQRMLSHISVTATLMELVEHTEDLPEDFLRQLGEHIREPLNALERIWLFFEEMQPVAE